jgi:general L-amino acid transport system permease protein
MAKKAKPPGRTSRPDRTTRTSRRAEASPPAKRAVKKSAASPSRQPVMGAGSSDPLPDRLTPPATVATPVGSALADRYDYVRTEDAPRLPPPRSTAGAMGWLRQNLFSSPLNSLLSIVVGGLALLVIWRVVDWAIIRAVWSGSDRTVCAVPGAGACWPFVWDKLGQWIYGFYPIDQRWRPNLVFLIGALAIIPMLIPSAPFKKWNGIFLLTLFPLIAVILLTGGHFHMSWAAYGKAALALLALAAFAPVAAFGLETGMKRNGAGIALVVMGLLPVILAFFAIIAEALLGFFATLAGWSNWPALASGMGELSAGIAGLVDGLFAIPGIGFMAAGLVIVGALLSLVAVTRAGPVYHSVIWAWVIVLLAVLAAMALLGFDFGLERVETNNWGGLLVTLVVSITGIVVSLPIGILMALGRRSAMPVIKAFSVLFIELWRGVPLITVLFMASVMLPLFFPAGTNFDKLIRVLIGIALFSAAYMAEVVRSGLQAIPKGQYEGAMALGLSYWQMMTKIILPQALKVAIPNIVGNFIGLFKDTTLVTIIGLFDLLGIIVTGANDAKWASAQTGPTGYFVAALSFWVFCFGMSRYAAFIERRLHTGHKR